LLIAAIRYLALVVSGAEKDNQGHHWRFPDEKVTCVDDALVLPHPGCRADGCLFLQYSPKQRLILWHGIVVPTLSFIDDEIYGT
jgi:hypothetical protein